ncbi:DUF485 domain-containing protein [Sporosarcina sp. HYO08]|uniref:DUF485 domain-containing protein n=1 Tax=Sporosarcina sp. HYO08 TaxID=1759557 RepID=UPI0007917B88|nr:DUF485 domain-containing protein [Sporosarcina sp. HYO08]KXH81905.1 hypothetical protein AU377_06480 [Sporosarcina sp. HYO08]
MTINVKDRYDSALGSNETTMDPSWPYQKGTETGSKQTYSELTRTKEFAKLIKEKKAFLLPTTIFFLSFYFLLPILAAYTDVLKGDAFFGLTWAWVYALLQFAVVWILGLVYMKTAAKYDITVKEILTKHKKELEK